MKKTTSKNNTQTSEKEPVPARITSNTQFTVEAYNTDPKLAGYQLLTNYESTYWARLVHNNEAWRLYEVLRSFCHDGKTFCYPSINYLTEILGLKERRVLTGWMKKIKDKEYFYQGLIDILQQFDLVTTVVEGSGRNSSYTFHVNLHPPLLTPAQVEQLPKLLQYKHAELLESIVRKKSAIEAKKRTSKFAEPKKEVANTAVNETTDNLPEGIGKLPMPIGNLPEGIGKLPESDYIYINNTNKTIPNETTTTGTSHVEGSNEKDVVVALLIDFGISKKIAEKLTSEKQSQYIQEKLAYAKFLIESAPEKIKNPNGWLRKALEEDYGAPDGFSSEADREAEENQFNIEQQQEEELARLEAARQQKQARLEEANYQAWRNKLSEAYGTTEEDFVIWERALVGLKNAFAGSKTVYNRFVVSAEILSRQDDKVLVGVDSQYAVETLNHRNNVLFEREFKFIFKKPMQVEFVVVGSPDPVPEAIEVEHETGTGVCQVACGAPRSFELG